MATIDFTPLFRSAVGFDHIPMLFTHAAERDDGYPPYNIEKYGEDQYRIVMALAGFSRDDIQIVCERNQLTVRGVAQHKDSATYMHRGISGRNFYRSFDLAEHIEVTGATMSVGLLVIDLKRELPEEMKPRQIEINVGPAPDQEPQRLESSAA